MITVAERPMKSPADTVALLSVTDANDGDANIFTTACAGGDAKTTKRITGTHSVASKYSSSRRVATFVAPLRRASHNEWNKR